MRIHIKQNNDKPTSKLDICMKLSITPASTTSPITLDAPSFNVNTC